MTHEIPQVFSFVVIVFFPSEDFFLKELGISYLFFLIHYGRYFFPRKKKDDVRSLRASYT